MKLVLAVVFTSALQTLWSNGVFTEGPALAPDGSIYFSDITGSAKSREAGHIMRYDPRTNRVTVFRSPSGMANGLVFDHAGRLIAAEGADFGGRRVTRTDMKTGKAERLATHYDGKLLNSPNDVAVDLQDRIYFSDPRYVGSEPLEQPVQAVYRIDRDGSVHRIVDDVSKPNGVAVSPDGKTLYVAATPNAQDHNTIRAYDLAAGGTATFREEIVKFSVGYADGLTVDPSGNIFCGCGPLGVRVYSPAGEELAHIDTPAEATNVEVAGNTLYITAGRGLYRATISMRPAGGGR